MVRPLEESKIWGFDTGGGKWRVFWARVEQFPEKRKFCYKIRVFDVLCDGKPVSFTSRMFLQGQKGHHFEGQQRIVNLAHAIDKMNGLVMKKVRSNDAEFLYYQQELQCIDEVNNFLDKYGQD